MRTCVRTRELRPHVRRHGGGRWPPLATAPPSPTRTRPRRRPTARTRTSAVPQQQYQGRPWALQRVLLDELWRQTKGKGVRVAVIDTGVDVKNPQLTDAVDA